MAYFKIGNTDFSDIVAELNVRYQPLFNSQTNASGNTVIDMINSKRLIEVKIITINSTKMAQLLNAIKNYNVSISYRDPITNELATGVNCLIDDIPVEYYTIQTQRVLYNETKLSFQEL